MARHPDDEDRDDQFDPEEEDREEEDVEEEGGEEEGDEEEEVVEEARRSFAHEKLRLEDWPIELIREVAKRQAAIDYAEVGIYRILYEDDTVDYVAAKLGALEKDLCAFLHRRLKGGHDKHDSECHHAVNLFYFRRSWS